MSLQHYNSNSDNREPISLPVQKADIEKLFGTAVRKWRERAALSQEQLARRAGLHRTYVCDVERGARNVSLKNIKRLADALAIPPLTLLAELGTQPPAVPRTTDELVDILMVEDNPSDEAQTIMALQSGNITNRFFVVRDGVAALNFLFGTGEFAHRHPSDRPAIILLDLKLPKIDGIEVLRRIKADPRTAAIPVVVLTGSRDARDIAECRHLGVKDYIAKPVTLESFSDITLRLNLQWALLKSVVRPG